MSVEYFTSDRDIVREWETKQFKVCLYCRVCGTEMVPSSLTMMSNPAQYTHDCPADKTHPSIRTSNVRYPYFKTTIIGEPKVDEGAIIAQSTNPEIEAAVGVTKGKLRDRFEYASGQYHDVTRWNEEGSAPDEKGRLVNWIFEANHYTIPPLQWSEEKEPSEECRYNHCDSTTPFGTFRIEWKGWKKIKSYTLEFDGEWIASNSTLEDCKNSAATWWCEKIAAIFEE